MSTQEPSLRVQINQIDYILEEPGTLDISKVHQVPVIRIYGLSSSGKKTCVNVHDVYHYFYIDYLGALDPNSVNEYIGRLFSSLNYALALSLKRSRLQFKKKHIRAIVLVKGVHFYGFHASYSPFLKILINDPTIVPRVVRILRSGVIMRTQFMTYESHLSYILQFMCDFNLYGCGWLDLGEVWQRKSEITAPDDDPESSTFQTSTYSRQSRMELEVDVASHQVLNRLNLTARNIHHEIKLPKVATEDGPLVHSVRELWEDERRRRRLRGIPSDPVMQSTPRERVGGAGGRWISEARWWQGLIKRIEAEKDKIPPSGLPVNWDNGVMTVLESVEALWDERWRRWRAPKSEKGKRKVGGTYKYMCEDNQNEGVDVDEKNAALDVEDLEENEDDDMERPFTDDVVDEDDDGQDDLQYDEEQPTKEFRPPEGHESTIEPVANATRDESTSEMILNDTHTRGKDTSSNILVTPPKRVNPFAVAWSKANKPRIKENITMQSGESTKPKSEVIPITIDFINDDESVAVTKKQTEGISQLHKSQLSSSFGQDKHESDESSSSSSNVRQVQSSSQNSKASSLTLSKSGGPNLSNTYIYRFAPPSSAELRDTLPIIYQSPFYSVKADAPVKPVEFAGLVYPIQTGDTIERWPSVLDRKIYADPGNPFKYDRWKEEVTGWEFAGQPPSVAVVKEWLEKTEERRVKPHRIPTQIVGPTPKNPYGYRISPVSQSQMNSRQNYSMSVLSLEILSTSQGKHLPNPESDAILAACCYIEESLIEDETPSTILSLMVIVKDPHRDPIRLHDANIKVVTEEIDLINMIINHVNQLDPDIMAGWEVQNASWGYLSARGDRHGLDVAELISRAPPATSSTVISSSQWDTRNSSNFRVAGRHVLNVWRVMRATQTLNIYTFENVAFHLLQCRVPCYVNATLVNWYNSGNPTEISHALRSISKRASLVIEMLAQAHIVGQTAEFARVFGVDFFSVLTRGSQFKVESFMFRIAKPENFVLISPSKHDVGKQNAAECMPLIMEPLSSFYTSPLVVLDFQSLYPSIMIAYNYCYSTCLGRVNDFKGKNKLGVTDYEFPPGFLKNFAEYISVAPNGMLYVKPEIRRGLLGRMLTELLDTRVMIKEAIKGSKDDKALQKILEARQLSLKYIANVTYGYTSASFSGRMPAVEIADSIVQSGRETLEKAIRVIKNTPRWGAEVVYGDTDSLFIYLPGKSKEQAFRIGHDIADTVTALNPRPIKLKFEKVYLPCVLMAKKRYVGFKYEDPDTIEPTFDAKGIETVRRDGIPAQAKMVETCLKILFRTKDLSQVKRYCQKFWSKMIEGNVSPQDFVFAKEVRLGTYSDRVAPIPGVTIAIKRKKLDPLDEPQYGERVPYLILRGESNARLYERAAQPEELLGDSRKRLDVAYYITKVLIPPLERIFKLVGADVKAWYEEMPKIIRAERHDASMFDIQDNFLKQSGMNQIKIDNHFQSSRCAVCARLSPTQICIACRRDPGRSIALLMTRLRRAETALVETHQICSTCSGSMPGEEIHCWSTDCPWLYERKRAENRLTLSSDIPTLVAQLNDI